MTDRDLSKRFQEAFKDPDKVKAEEYQKIIGENATKAAENAERLTFLLLSLVMMFILIIHGSITKVNLQYIEITNLSSVLVALPIATSYVYYNLVMNLSKLDQLSAIHKAIIKQRHRPIYEQRLSNYFLFTSDMYEYQHFAADGLARTIQSSIWVIQFFSITFILPIGFQVYAFWRLFILYTQSYPVLIASLLITILYSLQGLLTTTTLVKAAG